MLINGKRVFKTRVRIKGDELELVFYGRSPRGTHIMLGSVQPKKADLAQAIETAPAVLAKPQPVG